MEKLSNPKVTIEIIQKYNFAFQKRFGQNFLIDGHVIEKIIRAAEITKDDVVLEIGPGIGTMTQYLAEAAGEVFAVEIDKNLLPILAETLAEYDNVTVVNEDILKVDIAALTGGRPVKVVANLPYYITTPIIMGLFENHIPATSITVHRFLSRKTKTSTPLTVGSLTRRQPETSHHPLCSGLRVQGTAISPAARKFYNKSTHIHRKVCFL